MRRPAVVIRLAVAALAAALPSTAALARQPPPGARNAAAELACAPDASETPPPMAVRITGGQVPGRMLFSRSDVVLVAAATAQGLQPGQDYFVRRVVPYPFDRRDRDGVRPRQIHTAGWIRITEVHANTALATITHACDEVMAGDYLAPFELPAIPEASASGQADLTGAGRLVFGDEWRELGGAGSYMVLNRGSAHGVRPGQHVTIFRASGHSLARSGRPPGGLMRVGEATAMVVRPQTTTVRVDRSDDVIQVGDLGAINR